MRKFTLLVLLAVQHLLHAQMFISRHPFTDARDSRSYNTVVIGGTVWMKQNLAYGTYVASTTSCGTTNCTCTSCTSVLDGACCNGGTEHSDGTNNGITEVYALGNISTNINSYGALYDWNELTNYTGDTVGVCPTGWHIPSLTDWQKVLAHAGLNSAALFSYTVAPAGTNSNTIGFTAIGSGDRDSRGYTYGQDITSTYWTSTPHASISNDAWHILMQSGVTTMTVNHTPKTMGYSVRCIKNTSICFPDIAYCGNLGEILIQRRGISNGSYSAFKDDNLDGLPDGSGSLYINSSTGSIFPSLSDAGNYIVVYTYYEGTMPRTTGTRVKILPLIVPQINTNSTYCTGNNITFYTSENYASHSWIGPNNFSANTPTAYINEASLHASGIYTLLVTNYDGCTATKTVLISNGTPTISAIVNQPCENSPVQFLTNQTAATNFTWSGPSSFASNQLNPQLANANMNMQGTYTVVASNSISGCPNAQATVNLIIHPKPVVSVSNNGPVCSNNPVTLSAGSAEGMHYLWLGPSSISTLQAWMDTPPGSFTYSVIVTNPITNCSNQQTTQVVVNSCQGNRPLNGTGINVSTSTHAISLLDFSISPVPNQGQFEITFASGKPDAIKITVINLLGQTVHSEILNYNGEKVRKFDWPSLNNGTYFVYLTSGSGLGCQKIVIEK